ncbi:MAG: glycosyltransferase [archaeon]
MISVIIPAFNEERVIESTLKSLPSDVEKIVVCNACTDNTAEIARKYGKVVELSEKGVSKARNRGVEEASFDKIIFLDADIKVDENVISMILESNANIGTTKVKSNSDYKIDRTIMWLKSNIHRFGFNTGLIFCTKEMYERIGGFDESKVIHEDGKFLRAGKKKGRFDVLDCYVFNDMRRFRQKGYLRIVWFWVRETLFSSGKDYDAVR